MEHVEEKHIGNFLRTFECAKMVAMTHGLPGQPGYHHVNCKPSAYWIEKMEERGWKYRSFLTLWARLLAGHGFFAQSGLIFTKQKSKTKQLLFLGKRTHFFVQSLSALAIKSFLGKKVRTIVQALS